MGCRDLFLPHILLALILTTFVLIQLSFVYKQHHSTTWSVYHLKSDNEFIRTSKGYPYILVYDYLDDPYLSDVIHANSSRFEPLAIVGSRSSAAPYKALDVLGVTIHGDKLQELMEDLTLVDQNGQTFHLLVNRRGLCLLYVGSQRVMRLRINDRFGWSKYGVEPQIGSKWSVWDMSNGSVLYRDRVEDDDDDGSTSSSVGWVKLLEEKEKQVAALEAALEALIRDKRENKIKCDLNMVYQEFSNVVNCTFHKRYTPLE